MSRTSYTVPRVPRDNTGMNSAPGAANRAATHKTSRPPSRQGGFPPLFVRTAGPGRYCDGQGLYLFVQPSGTRSWVQRLVVRGRHQELGLGSAQLVPLAEAREKALANRKLAREGGDPRRGETPRGGDADVRRRRPPRAGHSNGPAGRAASHPKSWLASLERYAFPRIGTRLISDVTSADVLEILTPIWHDKAQTARRVRQRIRAVLEWAVAMELRVTDNPCDRIGPVLGPQQAAGGAQAGVTPSGHVPAAVAAVRACRRRRPSSRWRASGSC